MKGKKLKVGLVLAAILSVVILLFVFLWIKNREDSSQDNVIEYVYRDEDLYTLKYDSISNYVSASGFIHSSQNVPVTCSLKGTVEKIFVTVGDFVESGTLLFSCSTEEIQKELDELNQKYQEAENRIQHNHDINQRNYNQAVQTQSQNESNYRASVDEAVNIYNQLCSQRDSIAAESQEKYEMMLAADSEESRRLVSEEYNEILVELNKIEQKIESADISIKQAQSQYDTTVENDRQKVQSMKDILDSEQFDTTLAELSRMIELKKNELESVDVIAPVSGVLTDLNVSEGELFAGQNVATISTVEKYIARLEVNEMDIQKIQKGMIADICYGRDAQVSKGKVSRISQSKDITSSAYIVDVVLDDTKPMLGMSVTARINTNLKDNVLVAPYRCLSTDTEGNTYVLRINDSSDVSQVPEKIYIDTGVTSDNKVEIISDKLEEGQRLLYHD